MQEAMGQVGLAAQALASHTHNPNAVLGLLSYVPTAGPGGQLRLLPLEFQQYQGHIGDLPLTMSPFKQQRFILQQQQLAAALYEQQQQQQQHGQGQPSAQQLPHIVLLLLPPLHLPPPPPLPQSQVLTQVGIPSVRSNIAQQQQAQISERQQRIVQVQRECEQQQQLQDARDAQLQLQEQQLIRRPLGCARSPPPLGTTSESS